MGGELAGIVHLAGRRRVGHRLRPDEVLAPQRVGRDAEFVRGHIDQTLDQIGRLRPPGAAIGIDRQRVGEGGGDVDEAGGKVVDARQHHGADIGDVGREGGEIGAHVADHVDLERGEAMIGIEGEPGGGVIVAPLGIAEEVLAAVGDPFHRAFEPLRRDRRKRVFAIGKQLGAEAAADIRRHHAQLFRRDLEHRIGENVAHEVRALAAERQSDAVRCRVVFGDHGAGVEKIGDEALIDDAQRNDLGRRRKCVRGRALVAERHLEGGIAGVSRPHRRRARA